MPREKRPGPRKLARALRRGALVSLALGELTCPRPAAADSTAPVSTPAPAADGGVTGDEAAALASQLGAAAVAPGGLARKTLYTWTTRAQIEALAQERVLLTRSESPDHGSSFYDEVVHLRATQNDAVAKLLRTRAFARARFAWPAPWATVVGIGGERYGDELVEVTLKPDALIAVLRHSRPGWQVVDLANRTVPVAQLLAHPERLAAVHFVHDLPVKGYAASMAGPAERLGYREYVLCNESMIASFAVHTDSTRAALALSEQTLALLERWLAAHPQPPVDPWRWNERLVKTTWTRRPGSSPLERYEAALAFPDAAYLPTVASLQALGRQLRAARRDGPAIFYRPTAVFPLADTKVPAAPPARR